MKSISNVITSSFFKKLGWAVLFCLFPLLAAAQSYEQMWKEVEGFQQKDLPRSAIQQIERIYRKAKEESNVPQLMKAQLSKAVEQVKLTPDSADVEVARLKRWAETEPDKVTASMLYHIIGNIAVQKNEIDWQEVMSAYSRALEEKDLLLSTSAADYVPMTVSTAFSKKFFDDNLYDLLVHQTIAGLMTNWQWNKNIKVQEWIIGLYDSLIDAYGEKGLNKPTAALFSKEAKIIFLSQEGVVKQYHLSKEKTEKAFRDLLRQYEKSAKGNLMVADDALVDVRLKLAEVLCDRQELVEAMDVLTFAQQNYPKSSLMDEVHIKMDWINSPSLSMNVPVIYPSYKGQLKVEYKNVSEFKVETYRLRLTPDSPELNGNLQNEVLCRTYGKKISTNRYRLPATTDYKAHSENLAYTLPEAGIYMLKVSSIDRKSEADYQLMFVSPYQCVIIPLLDGRTEVVVVDRLSGNPVPNAEVVVYQRNGYAAQFTSPKIYTTDKQGSVILKNPLQGAFLVNARTPNCDFMKISSYYPRRNYKPDEAMQWRPMTSLFTDRVLYRPGQVVHVSGIRYEQLGDSLRTVQGKVMKVELVDVNGKRVSEIAATSDGFGVFSVDFTLPKQVLPGSFTIRTENKATYIQVENYKRPTFDVRFSPITKSYTFDDVVQAEGVVETFAGAPVRLAKGTYTIVRSEAWLWRRGGNESVLSTGTFTTDADGKFHFDVWLEAPFNKEDIKVVTYYNYAVKVAVTDGAGETQEKELTLAVGNRSLGLQIQGLKQKLACERKEKIQFQVMNLNKQLIKKEVNYQVFELSASETEPKVGRKVFEGKAMSQESFVPLEIYALPAGKYQLQVSTRDDQGRLVTTSQDFILFSFADKRPPIQTTQWFYQDGENWQQGTPVTLYVGSSENNVYLMMDVFVSNKRIRSERIWMKNSIQKFEFAYDESYGDGIVVSFAFIRNGKFYTKQVRLEKPKPQKELSLQWETFRDKLTPGQQEVWRMKITDHSGNPVSANLLGAMYDASLDKLQTHKWWMQPTFNRWLPYIGVRSFTQVNKTLFCVNFPYIQNMNGYRLLGQETYSRMLSFPLWNRPYYFYASTRAFATSGIVMKSAGIPNEALADKSIVTTVDEDFAVNEAEVEIENAVFEEELIDLNGEAGQQKMMQALRQNFSETAFYYPTLRTDAKGEVSISFTLPDALTEWKFMGLAHTQHLDYGMLTSKVKASKPFMVQPNVPRFVRIGDVSSLAVSLVNLSMETVEGKIRMELVDPMTNQVILKQVQDFKVAEGKTEVAQFSYKVNDNYDVLVCRVVADAGEFSDGEQHYLPVLTNKEWVTETIPFQVKADESIDLTLNNLYNRQSRTATGKRLTIELTANPNWYVIQAISVMANPANEDAVSWATAYYANALALKLVRMYPSIQQVFQMWLAEGATKETLWSKLETNVDLKQRLLQETPWLAEAQTEAEQKRRVALLFELNGMEQRLQLAAQQLKKLQTHEGGWTWYPGMPVNRYTSTEVVELMARLKTMGIKLDAIMDEAYRMGLNYLKQEAKKEYEHILKIETEGQKGNSLTSNDSESRRLLPSEQVVRYLYICALDASSKWVIDRKVNTFFIDRILHGGMKEAMSKSFSIAQKAKMATIMQANGKTAEAALLIQSVKEYLVSTPTMGSYFDTYKAAYSWNSYRIPTQVAAMEAIRRISPDADLLDSMKLWLLKQKQVQVWNTPLATVDAIYAFLMTDSSVISKQANVDPLQTKGKMKAELGANVVTTPADALGYTRVTFMEKEIPLKGKSRLHVEKEGNGIGWGSVYAQYFEEINKIRKSDDHDIAISREYLLNGQPIAAGTSLHVGDKLTIRFTIRVNRDMDFIRINDQRAACMEPADQLSGYIWNKGVSAYRVYRDASTEFFIDKLTKGKHVLEYQVYVNRIGTYQTGTASIQSVYAPEYASHTEGLSLEVRE